MKRETGYYWCKVFNDCSWTPYYWDGTKFSFPYPYDEDQMDAINETRLPTPDELQPPKFTIDELAEQNKTFIFKKRGRI